MRRIRVLVVDDSVVVRRLVTDVLSGDPDIEVVGIAANGRIALQKIAQLAPDLVTLDIEMPEMDGLTAIIEIRKTWSRLPVIMFSTLTARGAESTLEALARGATDYVTKPANVGSVTVAQQQVRENLIPKIKSLCVGVLPATAPITPRATAMPTTTVPHARPASGTTISTPIGTPSPTFRTSAPSRAPIGIVAIGSSTGGPNALLELIPKLPATFPVPVVITQHMPPMFTKFLADRLSALSALPVREATEGAVIAPGTIWIAPGDFHLVLRIVGRQIVASITKDPPENSCRPSVDVMMRSVVSCYGPRVLSVIMTGMGQDGLRGSEGVHDAGGSVFAQDEATSVIWGMPGFVARAGIASAVLPLAQLAPAIIDRVAIPSCSVPPSIIRAHSVASPPAMPPGVSWQ